MRVRGEGEGEGRVCVCGMGRVGVRECVSVCVFGNSLLIIVSFKL